MPGAIAAALPKSSAATYGAASVHHVEHARPASLVEEVNDDVEQPADTIGDGLAFVFIARRDERPVDEHWAADNVFKGNEAPETAIEADVAIIAHSPYAVRRHDDVAVLHE